MKLHEALEKCKNQPHLKIYNLKRLSTPVPPYSLENITAKIFSPMDLMDDNWEIAYPSAILTREKLAAAWDTIVYPRLSTDLANASQSTAFKDFCRELGL
jgi:hypothetical protein